MNSFNLFAIMPIMIFAVNIIIFTAVIVILIKAFNTKSRHRWMENEMRHNINMMKDFQKEFSEDGSSSYSHRPKQVACRFCGEMIDEDSRYCKHCGGLN